jgi:hypothetical protein
MITKGQSLETMHGEAMRNIDIKALAINDLFRGSLALADLLILFPWTFRHDQLMATFMDNARTN